MRAMSMSGGGAKRDPTSMTVVAKSSNRDNLLHVFAVLVLRTASANHVGDIVGAAIATFGLVGVYDSASSQARAGQEAGENGHRRFIRMIFLGIDPGLTGALAVIYSELNTVFVYDTPVLTVVKNKKVRHEMDIIQTVNMVRVAIGTESLRCCAAIERVNSMPDQGVASSFSFGKGFGIWLGILGALRIPFDLIHPVRWKKVMMDGMGKEKDSSRVRAKELFPHVDLSLKKHHGRADALLLAEYRKRLG